MGDLPGLGVTPKRVGGAPELLSDLLACEGALWTQWTPQRMEYTAIGSTVSIASRLCDLARPGEVVVSQTIVELLPKWATAQSKGFVTVKGIKTPLEVFSIDVDQSMPE